jgi:hypothetical protein
LEVAEALVRLPSKFSDPAGKPKAERKSTTADEEVREQRGVIGLDLGATTNDGQRLFGLAHTQENPAELVPGFGQILVNFRGP